MAKIEGIKQHIDDINTMLESGLDMQFKVELIKAKSIALLAATQNESKDTIKVQLGNAERSFKVSNLG